jgi:hypothetical protein
MQAKRAHKKIINGPGGDEQHDEKREEHLHPIEYAGVAKKPEQKQSLQQ